jgi:hypothetical protein
MRIKIDDKIYRLKEIESGVDSLMELVEEPKYKDGDFVYEDGRIMIFKSYPNNYHYIYYPLIGKTAFDDNYGIDFTSKSFRRATEEEKQTLLDELAKEGKRWNAENLCIEDIPKRKFKNGDKVVLKSGYKKSDGLIYLDVFDLFIGKKITVAGYTDVANVHFYDCPYIFDEDWLESYEELKEGDLAIFWDDDKNAAVIGKYGKFTAGQPFPHSNHREHIWKNALKFESKEQYERLIKGEI